MIIVLQIVNNGFYCRKFYDLMLRDGTECSFYAFLADDKILDNKSHNYYLKHNYHIFVF
jgi:hypothetical protein